MKKIDRNIFDLKNKNIVINGGLGLIGSEVVYALSKFNANITVLDKKNNSNKKLNKLKNIIFENYDTSNIVEIDKCFKKILESRKKIDVFINCSYPFDSYWTNNTFDKINSNSLNNNILFNTNSYVLFTNMFAKHMKKNNINGSIIQFASIYGKLGQDQSIYENTSMKENVAYSFLKGGVVNLSRQMAAYYGKYNIRVNTISPGAVKGHVAGKGKQPKRFVQSYISKNPIKRFCLPEDISPLCIFLSSSASEYITGQNFMVDGGWSII